MNGKSKSLFRACSALAALAVCGCGAGRDEDVVEVRSALTTGDVMGLETPTGWSTITAGARLSQSTVHDQGSFSLRVDPSTSNGYTPIASIALSKPAVVGPQLAFDVMLPTAQANPSWQGTVQIYLNCPSRGIYSAFLAQVELTGKPLGVWNAVSFPVPSATIASLLHGGYTDLTFTLVLNVAVPALGPYFLDNLRFLPAGPTGCGEMPNGTFCDDGDICTVGETCVAGACAGGTPSSSCPIVAKADWKMAEHFVGRDRPPEAPLACPNGSLICPLPDGRFGCAAALPPGPCQPPPCQTGTSSACTLACGGTGIRNCTAGVWGSCQPFERCNGIDDDCDGRIDNGSVCQVPLSINEPQHRPGWDATLDACGTTSTSGASLDQFIWDISIPSSGKIEIIHLVSTTCSTPFVFPREDSYPVTLTVVDGANQRTKVTTTMTIKNRLIVSMGDSIGSGEGNPDIEAENNNGVPVWQSKRCHRSLVSFHAQAAAFVEDSDPHSSVTFLPMACSGAGIREGILGAYAGIDHDGVFEKPQLSVAIGALQDNPRPIDALLVQVGANDMGFGDVVIACAVPSFFRPSEELIAALAAANFFNPPLLLALTALGSLPDGDILTCASNTETANVINSLADLATLYRSLNSALRQNLRLAQPDGIYIAQYPDPTRTTNAAFCNEIRFPGAITDQVVPLIPVFSADFLGGAFVGNPLAGIPKDALELVATTLPDGQVSGSEVVWAEDEVVTPLNQTIQNAAAPANSNWTFLSGMNAADAFGARGYCAPDATRLLRNYDESKRVQADKEGTLHPNAVGHGVYAKFLLRAFRDHGLIPSAP